MPDGTDSYSDAVYAKAPRIRALKNECPLSWRKRRASISTVVMGEHEQIGVVACCSVDEYDNDLIRKHERTRRDKEDGPHAPMITLDAQTGPVFLTYHPSRNIDTRLWKRRWPKHLDFIAEDGVEHTIWLCRMHSLLGEFRDVSFFTSRRASRAASASRARAELRDKNLSNGEEEYNRFLVVLFPADQLQILPYNRRARFKISRRKIFSRRSARNSISRKRLKARPTLPASGACISMAAGTD